MSTIITTNTIDYGDLPDTFKTLKESGGAAHIVNGQTLLLGQLIDGESNGLPTADATGDNSDNLNDEDGVVFGTLNQGQTADVTVTVTNTTGKTSYLNAWLDWDNSGTFEANEQIFSNEVVTDGVNNLTITVPADAVIGADLGARFRLSTSENLGSDNDNLPTNPSADKTIGGVNLGSLTDYLFFFGNGSEDANWQGATKGFAGDVAVNGKVASERTSSDVPYAGTIYTNDTQLNGWQDILDYNSSQAFVSTNEDALIEGLANDLNSAFTQINGLEVTLGYEDVSATDLNGLNTQNGTAETYVINVTKDFQVSSQIQITGDADDAFILRWDSDLTTDGYQGEVKFQGGGGIVPLGDLTAGNFIHVAGQINSSGGGSTPTANNYPQGPRLDNGTGDLIENGDDFNGGGFFTGYWLTTGAPDNPADSTWDVPYGKGPNLSNGIFVGGWYTINNEFSMTSGTSGVHVSPPSSNLSLPDGEVEDYFVQVTSAPPSTPTLSGYVYVDADDDGQFETAAGEYGIEGITMTLKQGSTTVATIQTDANGYYEFTGLAPGEYKILESAGNVNAYAKNNGIVLLDGKETLGTNGGGLTDNSRNNEWIKEIVINNTDILYENYNFGEIPGGSISGNVYDVTTAQDPIGGVRLTITGIDDRGKKVNTADTTDGNGFYEITKLRPGTYQIEEREPDWRESNSDNHIYEDASNPIDVANGNGTPEADPTPNGSDYITGIDLDIGESLTGYDFNEVQKGGDFDPLTGKISGYVFEEKNGTDNYQPGADDPISGILVDLYNQSGFVQRVSTDANGYYEFVGLGDGNYDIYERTTVGYIDDADFIGTGGGTVNNDHFSGISLANGQEFINYNFGEKIDNTPPLPGGPIGIL